MPAVCRVHRALAGPPGFGRLLEFFRRSPLAVFLLLAVVCAGVWGQVAGFGFVWDDETFLVLNGALRSPRYLLRYFTDSETMAGFGHGGGAAIFRPLRNVSYLLDFSLAGLTPGWFHVHNLLLHWLNACLVFLLAQRVLRSRAAAFFAAAFFAVHPVQAEVVAWIKSRDDLLAGLFLFSLTLLWLHWPRLRCRPAAFALLGVLYAAACLSKIQAVIAPLLLGLLTVWLPPGEPDATRSHHPQWRRLTPLIGLLPVGGVCVLWRSLVLGRTAQAAYPGGTFAATLWTMPRVAVTYLRLVIWPHPLVADYNWIEPSLTWRDPRVAGSLALLTCIAVLVMVLRRRLPVVFAGLGWFVICLLPVANLVPTMQWMAERFLYLSMAGAALIAGELFRQALMRHWRLPAGFGGLLLIAFALRAAVHVRVWESNRTLFHATALATPGDYAAPRLNLLRALVEEGRQDVAAEFAQALRASWQTHPSRPARASVSRTLGRLALARGDRDAAWIFFEESEALDPGQPLLWLDMGHGYFLEGNYPAALDAFTRVTQDQPRNSYAHYWRGAALHQLGRLEEAVAAFTLARRDAWSAQVHLVLARRLHELGRHDEADDVRREGMMLAGAGAPVYNELRVLKQQEPASR